MILKDLTFAFRNVRRNKLLATINVVGLSIGISACLIIFLIARYELSFDQFQPDKDRIYRIYSVFPGPERRTNPGIPTGLANAIRENFTGLESLATFHIFSGDVMVIERSGPKNMGINNKIIIAGPDYFEAFKHYDWIAGDPGQSLSKPFNVVLTQSRARIYFGDVDLSSVIGREIIYQDSLSVTVSGILKDVEETTDFDFTDFISFSTIEHSWLSEDRIELDSWNTLSSGTQFFIKLAVGTPVEKIEAQLLRIPDIFEAQYQAWDDWRALPKMQPLTDLHFNTELGIFSYSRSVLDRSTLHILIGIAGLLLLLAAINFINLETAQASRRAREVGVRKVLGSSRRKLISRFLSESFILSSLAVMLSVVWTELSFTYFPDYIPEGLQFHLADGVVIGFLFLCVVVVTLLAGSYPAFVMSSYRPVQALKNQVFLNSVSTRSAFVRKGLTIFQFSFAQVLVVGAVVVGFQLNYMLDKDLGFNPDAVVYLNTPDDEDGGRRFALKNELARIPEIEAFGMHGTSPISFVTLSEQRTLDNGKEVQVYVKQGDTSYLSVYGIELLAGRNLLPGDSARELLINETYLHVLGHDDPREVLGKRVDETAIIVGVVKDFHTRSLHQRIEPMVIYYRSNASGFGIRLFTPRNRVSDIKPALAKIEAAWMKVYPEEKFHPFFMSDAINRFYENERRAGKISTMAMFIALLISSLGLFGLSSFTVIQRTKEIGIRKVLGATVNSIMFLLSKEFLKLVLVAFILSTPVAWYAADRWLQAFAYKIGLTPWIFVLSGLSSVLIAFVTISFRTVGAAKADPVKSLKYE